MERWSSAGRLSVLLFGVILALFVTASVLAPRPRQAGQINPCPSAAPDKPEPTPATVVILVPGAATPAPPPSLDPTPVASATPSPDPNKPLSCTPVEAVANTLRTDVEQALGFHVGPLELLLVGLLGLAVVRLWREWHGRRVPHVSLEAAVGVKDETKAVAGPQLQERLAAMNLGAPPILPTPSVSDSVGKVLAETGVPPATALGKVLASLVSVVLPPSGYVATWSVSLPEPGSTPGGEGTVSVREAATGNVIGARTISGDDSKATLDRAADAIWALTIGSSLLGQRNPPARRWIVPDGSTYRDFREIGDLGDGPAAVAEAVIRLKALETREPFNAEVSLALGSRYTQLDDHLSAIDAFTRAWELASHEGDPRSMVGIDARYRRAAAYSFATSWLGDALKTSAGRARVRALQQRDLPSLGDAPPIGKLKSGMLDLAIAEYRAIYDCLWWPRVAGRLLRPTGSSRVEWRPMVGLSRFSHRGRTRLTTRTAQYVTEVQRFRQDPPTASAAIWIWKTLDEIRLRTVFTNHWQVEYNVICFISQSIGYGYGPNEADRMVVERLSLVLERPGTKRSASLRDWIACKDPDLHLLRDKPSSKFNLFWATRGGPCVDEQATTGADPVRRIALVAMSARKLTSIWIQRSQVVGRWATPNSVSLVGWMDQEQRVTSALLDWVERGDPADRRPLVDAVGLDEADLIPPAVSYGPLERLVLSAALVSAAETQNQSIRLLFERLVTERAAGKEGVAQAEALATAMRAAERWRTLERWTISGDAALGSEFDALVELETASSQTAPEDAEET